MRPVFQPNETGRIMNNIPPPDEIEPAFNPATSDAADPDSPIDESLDIEMVINIPEPLFNEATIDAAADELEGLDE
jgi:hypothetical protein